MRTVRVVDLLEVVAVDVAQRRVAGLRVLRVGDPLQREDHVVGADRLAVVELDAVLEADRPGIRLAAGGLDRLGDQHLELREVRRADGQRLVHVPLAHDVRVGRRQMRVDRVLRAAAGGADAKDAARAELLLGGHRGAGGARSTAAAAAAPAGREQTARAQRRSASGRLAQRVPAGHVLEPARPWLAAHARPPRDVCERMRPRPRSRYVTSGTSSSFPMGPRRRPRLSYTRVDPARAQFGVDDSFTPPTGADRTIPPLRPDPPNSVKAG